MSTLTQVEQATPFVPSAGQQVSYPKVGGQFFMGSDGIEKQVIDSRSSNQAISLIVVNQTFYGI
jgi:hypothetical protein